jgi:hypothetical protein
MDGSGRSELFKVQASGAEGLTGSILFWDRNPATNCLNFHAKYNFPIICLMWTHMHETWFNVPPDTKIDREVVAHQTIFSRNNFKSQS